jgi:hypothetical protein
VRQPHSIGQVWAKPLAGGAVAIAFSEAIGRDGATVSTSPTEPGRATPSNQLAGLFVDLVELSCFDYRGRRFGAPGVTVRPVRARQFYSSSAISAAHAARHGQCWPQELHSVPAHW